MGAFDPSIRSRGEAIDFTLVSSPDPTLEAGGKGSGDFGQFSWFGRL